MIDFGRSLLVVGGVIVLVGLLMIFWPALKDRLGFLSWLGRLPGDLVVDRPGLKVYFPLASSLLLSLVISLAFWFFRK